MKRFIEGEDRTQVTLLPECLDDYVGSDNPVRVVEAFVEQLDLRQMEFEGVDPLVTGRPAYHPAVLLKIYTYGYLDRLHSSRRLERETQRNGGRGVVFGDRAAPTPHAAAGGWDGPGGGAAGVRRPVGTSGVGRRGPLPRVRPAGVLTPARGPCHRGTRRTLRTSRRWRSSTSAP